MNYKDRKEASDSIEFLSENPPTLREMEETVYPDVGTGRYAIEMLALAVDILKERETITVSEARLLEDLDAWNNH